MVEADVPLDKPLPSTIHDPISPLDALMVPVIVKFPSSSNPNNVLSIGPDLSIIVKNSYIFNETSSLFSLGGPNLN